MLSTAPLSSRGASLVLGVEMTEPQTTADWTGSPEEAELKHGWLCGTTHEPLLCHITEVSWVDATKAWPPLLRQTTHVVVVTGDTPPAVSSQVSAGGFLH